MGLTVQHTEELTRKHVAEAFWNFEVESELRLTSDVDKFMWKENCDREAFMDEVDSKRSTNPYPHKYCSEECKKRGMT